MINASTTIQIAQQMQAYAWDSMNGILGSAGGGILFLFLSMLLLGIVAICIKILRFGKKI